MNLILHHLRKDIRAQRWLLVLWAIVLALKIGINLVLLQPDYHLASTANFIRVTGALTITGLILWAVLIVRLVQSEPVTGTTSFWLTRPVPRGVYVPSKLIFILVLLLVPTLIPPLLDLELYHVEAGRIFLDLRSLLAWYGLTTLVVLWLATYTRTMSEFWVVSIAIVLSSIALLAGFSFARFSFGSHGISDAEVTVSRMAMFLVVFPMGLVLSLIVQHAWRKIGGGFALGIGTAVVAILLLFFWPFTLPPRFASVVSGMFATYTETESYSSTDNKPVFTDSWRNSIRWTRNPSNDIEWFVMADFQPVTGQSRGIPVVEQITPSFRIGKGNRQPLPNRANGSYPDLQQDDFVTAITSDLPDIHFADLPPHPPSSMDFTIFSLDPDLMNRLRGYTGELSLGIFGHMTDVARKAEIPLGHDAVARAPGEAIHVARLAEAPSTTFSSDDPSQKQPALVVWTLSYKQPQFMRTPKRYYVLVDPQTKTGTFLSSNQSVSSTGLATTIASKSDERIFLPLKGDEPLDRMVLYIYESKRKDFFSTTLKANDFQMTPTAP